MAPGVELTDRAAAASPAPASTASTTAPPPSASAAHTAFARFAQQDLRGWSPIPTPRALVLYFLAVAIACAALGGPLLAASLGVVSVTVRYDDAGALRGLPPAGREAALAAANGAGVPVTVNVTVPRDMRPPIYIYYQLANFYQNHKRYVRSRDDNQMGGGPTGAPAEKCAPRRWAYGEPSAGAVVPCGLVAASYFNDTFAFSVGGVPVAVDESAIAWKNDAKHLFGPITPSNFNDDPESRSGGAVTGPLNEDQHFMVWMRPAARPTVTKLWGVIRQPLPAGSVVTIAVDNRYNTYGFDGAKSVLLTTNSWAGGRNNFLGAAYLAASGAAALTSAFFAAASAGWLGRLVRRRKFGDPSELSWNRKQE